MAKFENCLYADEELERKLGFPRFAKSNGILYMSGMLSADENTPPATPAATTTPKPTRRSRPRPRSR